VVRPAATPGRCGRSTVVARLGALWGQRVPILLFGVDLANSQAPGRCPGGQRVGCRTAGESWGEFSTRGVSQRSWRPRIVPAKLALGWLAFVTSLANPIADSRLQIHLCYRVTARSRKLAHRLLPPEAIFAVCHCRCRRPLAVDRSLYRSRTLRRKRITIATEAEPTGTTLFPADCNIEVNNNNTSRGVSIVVSAGQADARRTMSVTQAKEESRRGKTDGL
jgi:hypothetical protein